jgi:hypothetical protein
MGLLRLGLFGAAAYGVYRIVEPLLREQRRRTYDGMSAVFQTREQADLAVEHLVQEHGIDRAFIYVEPVGDENSAGPGVSGGDHASGRTGSHDRPDGSHNGAIEVSVPLPRDEKVLRRVLDEAGAERIEVF